MTHAQPEATVGAGDAARNVRTSNANAGHSPAFHNIVAIAAMFALGVGVIILRRPDAVTYSQFWAEDGSNWFADAYNMGAASLFHSYQGYLVTLPRLVAIPAVHLSLQQAALLFNLIGISVQVAPAAFFMSRRFEHVAPRLWVRALVGIAYLLLPSLELNAAITNSLWHLAILAVMVLVARPTGGVVSHVFDACVILLSGLTGPFAALLLPASVARALITRSERRWYLVISGMLSATLALQGWVVVHSHRAEAASLGAGLKNLVFLISDRIVLPGSFAEEAHTHVYTEGQAHGTILAALITVLAAAIIGFVLLRSGWPIRIFVLFCLAVTATSLLFPLASGGSTNPWTVMASTGVGDRYFFSAEVAWVVCVICVLSRLRAPGLRWGAALAITAIFASGLADYPQYPLYADFHPAAYDSQLRAAAPGTVVVVPINPGGSWAMELRGRN